MRSIQFLCSVLAFSTLSSAWPEIPENWKEITHLDDVEVLFAKRQNGNSGTQTPTSSGGSATSTTSPPSSTTNSESSGDSSAPSSTSEQSSGGSSKTTGSSGTSSGTSSGGSSKGSGTATSSTSSSTFIDPRLGPGGVQMITPAPTAQATYYKIGNTVTFAWNYTSLISSPSAIDILASCTANQQVYTLAQNTSLSPTATFLWDTGAWQANSTQSLLTETYTLVIHDAAQPISATPQAGHLALYNQFTFGMYLPQSTSALPNADNVCITCSGAMSSMERQTVSFLFGMAAVTVLSFSWFAGGFGLF